MGDDMAGLGFAMDENAMMMMRQQTANRRDPANMTSEQQIMQQPPQAH